MPVSRPSLSLEGISKTFGGLRVLDDLTLNVDRGTVHGFIGPNGAGKTTAINIATGHYRPDTGAVWLDGEDVTQLPPHARAGRGLARTFQGGRLFGKLDARTNIRIAVEQRRRARGQRLGSREVRAEVDQVIASAGLEDIADSMVSHLPYGRQKQIEMARAVSFADVALLLDEPTAGLSDHEIKVALRFVLANRERLAILIIEHNMDLVMSVCDQVTVINAGCHLATGTPQAVQSDQGVIDAYLGS